MFNSLTGILTGKFPRQIFITTQGIEWSLTVPDSSIDKLPPVGEESRIFTWLSHTENGMDLYGFSSIEERALFFDLIKVDGIGAKAAVKIMSNISSSNLITALEEGNLDVLEKVQGIGKKTAAKMLLALKGKLSIPSGSSFTVQKKNIPFEVVVSSLCDMGYEKTECENVVLSIFEEFSKIEDFNKKSQTEKEDAIFRKALMELAR